MQRPFLPIICGALLTTLGIAPAARVSEARTTAGARGQASGVAKIGSVRVSGEKKFSAEQVIAATGLKAGQPFDVKDLDAAAERLGKSGAFPDVSYSYVPEAGIIAVAFKVEEAAKFRACVFDNFVWLSPDEIQKGLRRDVPLFIGVAPETGDILDDISRALEKLSKEKGVAVQVTRRIDQARIGDPNWSHLFVAEGAKVNVQSLRFSGTLTVNQDDLKKEAARLVGRDYSAFQSALFASATILPYYRERGYLQARVGDPTPQILAHVDGSAEFAVEVVYPVTEGSVYKWSPPEWSGNQLKTSHELEAATGMKGHEAANAKKVDQGWDAVRLIYFKNGYIDAKLVPDAIFDESSHHVQYRVTVTEGAQYRMGTFSVSGTSQTVEDRVKKGWRLKTGEAYDASYVAEFRNKDMVSALQGVPTRISRFKMLTDVNREQHVVNVTMQME